MLTKTIASLQHPIIKYFSMLRKERAAREEHKEVVLSGEKLVREVAAKRPLSILLTLREEPEIAAKEKYIVSEEMLKKVSGLVQPDGFAGTCPLPEEGILEDRQKILILDQISDPGNLGTLFRTALALGWEGVWLTPGTVDPFNDKAIRAARGANFWLPLAWKEPEEIVSWAQEYKSALYLAHLEGEAVGTFPARQPTALILSNESHGARKWPAIQITIPMSPGVESLNVATSGAILLFALRAP